MELEQLLKLNLRIYYLAGCRIQLVINQEVEEHFNKQSTTQPHQIHGPHFFFPFRYRT
ncbi:hypothetical protein DAPPUDRAFT_266133 [Daphnia pulex]|uniref:Uncharacterized protein n=1 Tax=Daphnia pulex TaxID=6669 RepID=E9HUJ6_DAPPU|nr:hypothetical protein DAPPUDRAFT_266133 [Daphnia pulex]|eukprot:EFX64590.1 hypothetical protein DAPPUDRAFT_266133 [Daphnia pulex]